MCFGVVAATATVTTKTTTAAVSTPVRLVLFALGNVGGVLHHYFLGGLVVVDKDLADRRGAWAPGFPMEWVLGVANATLFVIFHKILNNVPVDAFAWWVIGRASVGRRIGVFLRGRRFLLSTVEAVVRIGGGAVRDAQGAASEGLSVHEGFNCGEVRVYDERNPGGEAGYDAVELGRV